MVALERYVGGGVREVCEWYMLCITNSESIVETRSRKYFTVLQEFIDLN